MHRPAFRFALFLLTLAPSVQAEEAPQPASTDINPQVVAKVVQLGEYLRSLPRFQVDAQVTRDTVLDSGQNLQMQSTSRLQVAGHDHVFARSDSDTQTREFYYDGKRLTQYSPYLKYYTTLDAPGTLLETLHKVEDHYGLQFPMEDLFLFGQDQAAIDALTSALYVGPSTINGQLCDHLAFRQPGVDWQLWVTRSDKPLPCKLVITTIEKPSRPEYSAVYRWNLQANLKEAKFTFTPGKGDVAIPLKKADDGQ